MCGDRALDRIDGRELEEIDVARLRSALESVRSKIERTQRTRDELLAKLDG